MFMNGSAKENSQKAAWVDARTLGIGGSDVAVILGISPWKSQYQLWLEKTRRVKSEDISALPHVQRGIHGEKIARLLFEQRELRSYKPKSWEVPGTPWRCNDDGYSLDDNSILEIKCMGRDKHEAAKNGIVPDFYLCQCHYNMAVSKAERCFFISFVPETEDMAVIEVRRDPVLCEDYLMRASVWWDEYIKKDVPPELTMKDKIALTDEHALGLARSFESCKERVASAKIELEAATSKLHELVTEARPAVRVGNLTVSMKLKNGAPQYRVTVAKDE